MTDEIFNHLEKVLNTLKEKSNEFSVACNSIGLNFDSKLADPFFRICDIYIETLSLLVGDSSGWIDYYVYECEFGNYVRKVRIDDEEYQLDTIEDLRFFIENS